MIAHRSTVVAGLVTLASAAAPAQTAAPSHVITPRLLPGIHARTKD
jgi:hypothetical protein